IDHVVVIDREDLAQDAGGGHHLVAGLQPGDQRLVGADPALLREDHHRPGDQQHDDEEDDPSHGTTTVAAPAGSAATAGPPRWSSAPDLHGALPERLEPSAP